MNRKVSRNENTNSNEKKLTLSGGENTSTLINIAIG